MKKKLLVMLMLIAMVFSMAACAEKEPEEADQTGEVTEQEELVPAAGGNLKLSVTRFNTINPLYNNERSLAQVQGLVYEGLIALDGELKVTPALAKSWTISPDGQTIDFVLRGGVQWHDGTPFTAADVVFTYQVIQGKVKQVKGSSIYSPSLQYVSDMKDMGDNVLRVTLNQPYSNALEVMTFPILPKHLFEGNNSIRLTNDDFPMVGTGPYQVADHHRMQSLVLEKNKNHWGKQPYIDTIEVEIVPDSEAQISLFDNGDLDFVQPLSIDWGKFADNKNIQVYEFMSNRLEFLGFNFKNTLLANPQIRKAIAYGIDRHQIVKNIYLGHGTVTDAPLQPNSWLYDQGNAQYGYEANKAIGILETQGFHLPQEGGVRESLAKDFLRFKLITNKGNLLREKTAFLIQEDLAAIGIEIEVIPLDWEAYQAAIATGNFDMILGGWELSFVPDLAFAFHSSGQNNFISYRNEETDRLLEEALRATTQEAKLEAYHALQAQLVDELPYFNLLFQHSAIMLKSRVKGEIHPHGVNQFYGIEHWFIKE